MSVQLFHLIFLILICTQINCEDEELRTKPDILKDIYDKVYKTSFTRVGPDNGKKVFLTSYIEKGQLLKAKQESFVDPDEIYPDIESYSGYLTVDKKYNSNLWFWFFPVSDKTLGSTPWIIWLQGGPGASSLYGLFEEIGPFTINKYKDVELRKYSWAKNHSLLFIDNPVGTGFSFTDDEAGYATNQTTIAKQLYDALQQFLTVFCELRTAPLIISGESYAGKHIPSLAMEIHENKNKNKAPINLYGLAIGNGFIDPYSLCHYSDFAKHVGIVDDNDALIMKRYEDKVRGDIDNGNLVAAFWDFNRVLSLIRGHNYYNYLKELPPSYYEDFLQLPHVRNALHVGNTEFTMIGRVYEKLIPDFMNSAKKMLEKLIEHYKVMSFNGQLDIIVAYSAQKYTYNSLIINGESGKYKKAERHPWKHNKMIVGFYKEIGNFLEVMPRNAGHMVPADSPSAALGLITAFANGIPLSNDTGYLTEPDELNDICFSQ